MSQHRRFTKAFADEAVTLFHNSGRTRRKVAEDLGIDLVTLARWSCDSRDHGDGKPDAHGNKDVVAELKRLRREIDVLRQARDILKKVTVFFANEGRSRTPMIRGIIGTAKDKVRTYRSGKERVPHSPPLRCTRRQPEWLLWDCQ